MIRRIPQTRIKPRPAPAVPPAVGGAPAPPYLLPADADQAKVFLAIEPFKRHMTDEGWQLQIGLEHAGYELWGRRLPNDCADVPEILRRRSPAVAGCFRSRSGPAAGG